MARHARMALQLPAGIGSALLETVLGALAPIAARAQRLPLGDWHVASHPAVGYVYSCRTAFRAGAAMHSGPWIDGDTWNPAAKPHVAGKVFWPDAHFTFERGGSEIAFHGNGLPVGQPTGAFPIARSDPAHGYDPSPNRIAAQHLAFDVPAKAVAAEHPGCLPTRTSTTSRGNILTRSASSPANCWRARSKMCATDSRRAGARGTGNGGSSCSERR